MRLSQASQLVALLVLATLGIASAQNVSAVLEKYPQYSTFAKLAKDTGVINVVQSRNSLTILLPDNGILDPYVASHPNYTPQEFADVIRYHILLQYFGGQELANITSEGLIVTTLFQTTGRANDLDGFVNLTRTAAGTVTVGPSTPSTQPQANIVTNVTQFPYNYSFIQISAVLEPLGLAAAQLAPTTAPSVAPTPVPSEEPSTSPSTTPAEAPVEAPIESPVVAPVESPVRTPVVSPAATPAKSPTAPTAKVPAVAPAAPVSSGFAVRCNAVAVVASLAVAALCL